LNFNKFNAFITRGRNAVIAATKNWQRIIQYNYSCGQAKSSNLILSFWALPDTRENSENYRNSIISNQ
jgi:hypothetical protein